MHIRPMTRPDPPSAHPPESEARAPPAGSCRRAARRPPAARASASASWARDGNGTQRQSRLVGCALAVRVAGGHRGEFWVGTQGIGFWPHIDAPIKQNQLFLMFRGSAWDPKLTATWWAAAHVADAPGSSIRELLGEYRHH